MPADARTQPLVHADSALTAPTAAATHAPAPDEPKPTDTFNRSSSRPPIVSPGVPITTGRRDLKLPYLSSITYDENNDASVIRIEPRRRVFMRGNA
ncbi:hypothetical protein [Burkholderia pseudomallei]|uniref:hypothetical protein n=1 Tax=Burkholderia pseudomallei TaxID=28450 RepID=UPI0001736AF3|nr:hypothetical protein [Burkholderia pseudomallei]EDU12836.1 hypothetical protein BURPS1655_D1789 [Burkholderia pseudomallei 1655]KGS06538.1 hypothetical protein X977_2871 [Burkholderia pseudomallei MSHR7504]KGS73018.1 hypothetical protein X942_5875 [Burkholderia pseudomallei MSHR5596]UZU18401.1 hypothetical protein OSB53_20440 [Burkholderia pseudomallei]UZU19428.1 hypothetical protein OSB35_07170 [Burkholderia pseudomallei]